MKTTLAQVQKHVTAYIDRQVMTVEEISTKNLVHNFSNVNVRSTMMLVQRYSMTHFARDFDWSTVCSGQFC